MSRSSFAQLRIVTYNDSGNVAGSGTGLQTVLHAIGDESHSGIQRPLDILSLQEQDTSLVSTTRVVTLLNSIYGAGTYASSGLTGAGDSTQSVIYNKNTVQLVSQAAILTTSSTGAARQPLRFQFRPAGYSSTADFYLYSSHFKADDDVTSTSRRGVEAAGIRANADALGAGARVIYTGDFNTYYSNEAAIKNLTAAGGGGQAFDPINRLGSWHNSSAYADVDTQSPVSASGGFYPNQVGGGLDDRFDFQLVSAPLVSSHGLSYINGTYHAFGNANGLQFNNDLTMSGAAAALLPNFPGYTVAQVQSALQAVTQASDHLPVVADYRLPAKMTVTANPLLPSTIIVGASSTVSAVIANTAPVTSVNAADELDYSASLSGSQTPPKNGVIQATGAAQTQSFLVDTAAPGMHSATLDVTSSSPSVANGVSSTNYAYTVVAHATPSLQADALVTQGAIDFGIVAIGRTGGRSLAVSNLADVSGYTARLDLTGASLTGSPAMGTGFTALTNIQAGKAANVPLSFAPTVFGTSDAALSIATSDEDLPGGVARDNLHVTIQGFGAFAGDANTDNKVDFNDLVALAQSYNRVGDATWRQGDFNGDHAIDFNDLVALAQNYGLNNGTGVVSQASLDHFNADWALAQSMVPEPLLSSVATGIGALMVTRRRRAMC